MPEINILKRIYKQKKTRIQKRLNEFHNFQNQPVSWFYDNDLVLKNVSKSDNERIFEELVFCILTANTSAVSGLKAVDTIRDILENGSLEEIQMKLKEAGYRFPNKRAEYICEARKFKDNMVHIINSYEKEELREFLVQNVKGMGYKEASHFMRNIGIFGIGILDKHILNTLVELNVIDEIPKGLSKNNYLEIEKKLKTFSDSININIDELDLLLWSLKNGRILK